MPPIHRVPDFPRGPGGGENAGHTSKLKVSDWFTEEMFETICPYAKASSVFTHDGEAFWRYKDFIESIEWMNKHENPIFHNFGSDSDDHMINMLEVASFMGNGHQETGDPSLKSPYPFWPSPISTGAVWEGFSGGFLGIAEGCIPSVFIGNVPSFKADLISPTLKLSAAEKKVIGLEEDTITGIISSLSQWNQPSFGLGKGTGAGAVFQPKLVCVSDDGTLWGDEPVNEKVGKVYPSKDLVKSETDRRYANLGPYSQYGGKGAIQLSYNYNYSDCTIDLFNDYRLCKYPNLIITTDRETFLGKPFYFGFAGPNPRGDNQLPQWIKDTTPPARIMAWLVCLWFWQIPRSGRVISCHQAMLNPFTMGITTANGIINNDSGLRLNTWAWNKNRYYERVCRIMGISEDIVQKSIVSPPHPLSLLSG